MNKIDRANYAIRNCGILDKLAQLNPQIVSTIMVGLDTNHSDIDVICECDQFEVFQTAFESLFSEHISYTLRVHLDHVLGSFIYDDFMFEVYASTLKTPQQNAYRHYKIMERLVDLGGKPFQDKIRKLKHAGLKTEPAICHYLQIEGDPYTAILEIEHWGDETIENRMARNTV